MTSDPTAIVTNLELAHVDTALKAERKGHFIFAKELNTLCRSLGSWMSESLPVYQPSIPMQQL